MTVFHVTRMLHAFEGKDSTTGKLIFRKIAPEEDQGLFTTKDFALESIKRSTKIDNDISSYFHEHFANGDIYRIPFNSKAKTNYYEWHYRVEERTVYDSTMNKGET